MEEFHPDRGDTQRSVFVYQNIPVRPLLRLTLRYKVFFS